MSIEVPDTVEALVGPLPSLADKLNYPVRGRAVHDWETGELVPVSQIIGTQSKTNADDALISATAARGSGFRGDWSAWAGALMVPASVRHNGRLWLLLEDVPDVTAVEPGVSPVWFDIGAVRRSGGTMLGHLEVPANATGNQTPRAGETLRRVGGAARLPTWTTAGRPGAPQDGDTGFNTTLRCRETYNGTLGLWVPKKYLLTPQYLLSGFTSVDIPVPVWANHIRVSLRNMSNTDGVSLRFVGSSGVETTGYLGMSVRVNAATVAGGVNLSGGFHFPADPDAFNAVGEVDLIYTTSLWLADGTLTGANITQNVKYMAGRKQMAGSTPVTAIRVTTIGGAAVYTDGQAHIMYES